ncbi:MAG: SAM-dependent methyltransferase [Candidatus Methylacidiphilales bacterium]|nr:SAM-dependent methyltransferase [Candidatus Methylacidiphilales bacterium]
MEDTGRVVTWEEWMNEALHAPGAGYYARHIGSVGERGDFSTSATLDRTLARGIACWLRARAALLKPQGRIAVIEVGPGDGALARGILRALPWWFRWRVDLHLVETSDSLRKVQQTTLRGRRVRWHTNMADALAQTGGRALIYSNELVDAFPCRSFILRAGTWLEIAVAESPSGNIRECESGPGSDVPCGGGAWLSGLREGQRIEIHQAYQRWLAEWASLWLKGAMLTVDYGYTVEPPPRLPLSGTLRAYFRQMRLEGEEMLRRKGRQDLTADVNFSDLARWGAALGWVTTDLRPQADWLQRWVPGQGGRLADPVDAGGAFLVLEQRPAASAQTSSSLP